LSTILDARALNRGLKIVSLKKTGKKRIDNLVRAYINLPLGEKLI